MRNQSELGPGGPGSHVMALLVSIGFYCLVFRVEQQLMSRMISELYRPPPSDPAQNVSTDHSESEERSVTSDIGESPTDKPIRTELLILVITHWSGPVKGL